MPKLSALTRLFLLVIILASPGRLGNILPADSKTAFVSLPRPTPSANQASALMKRADTRLAYHALTGKVRFVGASPQNPILLPPDLHGTARSPADSARAFLRIYGSLFGLTDADTELRVRRNTSTAGGRRFTRFQQVYRGIPVFGGELIVQSDSAGNIISAGGEILPDITGDTAPAIPAEVARQTALALVSKIYALESGSLRATSPELWIYDPALVGPRDGPTSLVWRLEVTATDLRPVRETVLIDARRGTVVLNFGTIDTARTRLTYTAQNGVNLPGVLVCTESNPACSGGDDHAIAAHKYAGDTYDFYFSYHGRDSIDNAGKPLVSSVHYGINYDNAFWNGEQMVYGDASGWPLADDIVGHELTHGVTGCESQLFYFYQSGAISESFSDLWGEFIDLTNGRGTDTAAVRWLIGEDVAGSGAIRNMQNPTAPPTPCVFPNCSGAQNPRQPDKMTSVYYYLTDNTSPAGDNGGVHINSGINNKAVYLLTDGGAFNGRFITGLGIAKVARIYYEVQTNLLTSGSDYADLYEALYQGCLNLAGTEGITSDDCQQTRTAAEAVEMNLQPAADYNPDAEICSGGGLPADIFYDDFENGAAGWILAKLSGSNHWTWSNSAPNGWGPNAHSGAYYLYANDSLANSDSYAAMAQAVAVPPDAYLHFFHHFDTEAGFDGGVIEYSADGGEWTDAGSLIDSGRSYSGRVKDWNDRESFTGTSHGYVSTRLNLSPLAGHSVRFRWRLRTDPYFFKWGWWLDDVRLYTCGEPRSDVGLVKKATWANAAAGAPITFTLELANFGWAQAAGVVVKDILPAEIVSPAIASSIVITPQEGTRYVWNTAPLTVGQRAVITITAYIDAGLPADFVFHNTAAVSDIRDARPANNVSSVMITGRRVLLPLIFR